MLWHDLIAEITAVGSSGSSSQPITGIEYDSRRVRPGAVFVAMKGGTTDGNRYIDKGPRRGRSRHPHRLVADLRSSARLQRRLAGARSRTWPPRPRGSLRRLLRSSGKEARCHRHHRHQRQNHHRLSHRSAAQRRRPHHSSHRHHRVPRRRRNAPLAAHHARVARPLRVDGRRPQRKAPPNWSPKSPATRSTRAAPPASNFDVAVFTNLTRDHLDYHQTMEKYFAAKRLLFDGTRLSRTARRGPQCAGRATASSSPPRHDAPAPRFAPTALAPAIGAPHRYTLTPAGATLQLETPAGSAQVTIRLAGEVNILNLLAAFTAAHARGVPFDQLVAAVPHLKPVPGRFQPVDAGQPFTVIVDYAHTDDALRNLTALARQMTAQTHGPRAHRLRMRRRSRSHQAPEDGQSRGRGKRFRRRHQRQSALRRSARHPRRNRAGPQSHAHALHH